MRLMTMVSSAAVLVVMAGVVRVARAEEVPIGNHSPTKVEGKCNELGGYFVGRGASGIYGCFYSDGSGIICGGVGPFAKTCTIFGPQVVKNPKSPKLDRDAIISAEKSRLLMPGK